MRLKLALALSFLAARSQPDLEVTLRDNKVVVRTTGAPLAEVLSRLAAATGTEVVYESPRPRQRVSLVIEAATVAEAITRLLEGQGLNYILRLDPAGRNVEMLLITGSAGTPAAAGGTRPTRSGPPSFRPPEEEPEPGGTPEPFPPEEPEDPSATLPEDGTEPVPEFLPPGSPALRPQEPPSPGAPSGSPAPQPAEPQPPGPASYPTSPPQPPPPVYPGPASYPPQGD